MTNLYIDHGNLWSTGTDCASGLSWHKHDVRHPTVLPATLLMAYAGRPVTDPITHPRLSADMTIIAATPDGREGALRIKIAQPRWLVCHHSGRTWESNLPTVGY